jgi:hypothetical protein
MSDVEYDKWGGQIDAEELSFERASLGVRPRL